MMNIDLQTYLPDDILTKVDRASMANALEVRAPLLDYRIVEYVSQLPIQFKIAGGIQKVLFKKLLKKYIADDQILNRKKMGFCLSLDLWLRKELKYLLETYLSKDAVHRAGFFNWGAVNRLVQGHLQGRDHSNKLFALLTYQIWHHRYIERLS